MDLIISLVNSTHNPLEKTKTHFPKKIEGQNAKCSAFQHYPNGHLVVYYKFISTTKDFKPKNIFFLSNIYIYIYKEKTKQKLVVCMLKKKDVRGT